MKKIITLTCAALFICHSGFAADKLSLRESIALALRQNVSLIKSQNNIGLNTEALKIANSWYMPSLGVNGGFDWQHQSLKSGGSTENRSWSLSVGGDVTLFDGLANYAAVKQKEHALSSAKLDIAKLQQDVILQTTNLYISILSSKKLMDFQKEELSYNRALLEKIKQMYEIKSVAVTDVFSQEAQTANAELTYLQAENNYQKSRLALLNYLAIDINKESDFTFDTTAAADSIAFSDFNSLYQQALDSRGDYQSSLFKVKASEQQINISRGQYWPQVSGSYGLSTGAGVPGDLFKSENYSLGLRFSMPIFSQFSTESAVQTASIQLSNNNEDLRALERQIKTDVKTSYLDMQTAQKQYEVTIKAAQAAELSWKAKKETYTLGAASYLDLQLSYNNYLQAQYNMISKEYGYIYSRFALMGVIGKLQ